jgi:hypothetical protein
MSNFPHEMVGYSLTGHQTKHTGEQFASIDCHGEEIARFEITVCGDCHREIDVTFMEKHQTAFGGECLACHDGIDTYGGSFDHNLTAFSLTGKHTTVDCGGCHSGARTIADLQATPTDCYNCHAKDDAHGGQLGSNCEACHVTDGWEQASIDHDLTGFPLVGKHQEAACQDCHQGQQFEGTPTDCFSCHAEDDTHGGQFGTDCSACHTPAGWEEVNFDHSLTAFPLTGRHIEVECTGCHGEGVFTGKPTVCVGCHEEPLFHQGLFDATCEACHTTDGWTPAQFNGIHTIPIDHGEGGASSCRTCHADSLVTYTCYGCHEHTTADIAEEHLKEGIGDFADCTACHPTGQKEEGGGGDEGGDDD